MFAQNLWLRATLSVRTVKKSIDHQGSRRSEVGDRGSGYQKITKPASLLHQFSSEVNIYHYFATTNQTTHTRRIPSVTMKDCVP